jgi:hypothetical protein
MANASPSPEQPAAELPRPTATQREQMIAVAAYYLAERRDFAPGCEQADWLDAERQIDLLLERASAAGVGVGELHRMGLRNALSLWSV